MLNTNRYNALDFHQGTRSSKFESTTATMASLYEDQDEDKVVAKKLLAKSRRFEKKKCFSR